MRSAYAISYVRTGGSNNSFSFTTSESVDDYRDAILASAFSLSRNQD
jgi:hypothetical protein